MGRRFQSTKVQIPLIDVVQMVPLRAFSPAGRAQGDQTRRAQLA